MIDVQSDNVDILSAGGGRVLIFRGKLNTGNDLGNIYGAVAPKLRRVGDCLIQTAHGVVIG